VRTLHRLPGLVLLAAAAGGALIPVPAPASGFAIGDPGLVSMGSLEFGPDAVLFIGDSKGGAVVAVDTGDRTPGDREASFRIPDVETRIAALLGAEAGDVMIHDMAVNPISRNIYVSVSRGRSLWSDEWSLPNDLADADLLLRILPDDSIEEFVLDDVPFSRLALPNPVDPAKTHQWKEGLSLRVDAITAMVCEKGKLYVSGLSNEEFSAALWMADFPFTGETSWSTVEIFHGAHGAWETAAPIRTFVPYTFAGADHILAAYLCTPLVTFPVADLADGGHVKGRTIAEFGSGNYPLDLVRVTHGGKDVFVMANSQLPMMTFTPAAVAEHMANPGITRETPTYTEGVPYVARAHAGTLHLDVFNDRFLAGLQRMSNGKLDLVAVSVARMVF